MKINYAEFGQFRRFQKLVKRVKGDCILSM